MLSQPVYETEAFGQIPGSHWIICACRLGVGENFQVEKVTDVSILKGVGENIPDGLLSERSLFARRCSRTG